MAKKMIGYLPSIITGLSMAMAWLGTVELINNNKWAFVAIAVAFMLDCADGSVARYLKVGSQRGRQLDSLADALIYVVWPALAYYVYFGLHGVISIGVQAVFIASGLYRLARFNEIGYVSWKGIKGYPGLPVVFSLLIVWGLIVFRQLATPVWANLLILIHCILMVQRFPFPRPKNWQVVGIIGLGMVWVWRYL